MKHNHQRWIAAAMSLALSVSCAAGPAFAASPTVPVSDGCKPTYDEAYYATLDYYGNLTEGSIVKSYVLNGATSITDYGEYEDVSNLTNSVAPQQNAKQLAFDFAGESAAPTHFYFQGKTAQPFNDLPWKLTVSYKLNGVPTKAEDLAGKTGVVEINIDAIPNKSVSDYARHNYTLESMAIFNQDDILSLEAPGAQVQLLGNLRAVLFVAFPGEEGHYSIRVGADKFQFGGMTFLMVPATLSQLDEISKLAQRKEDLESNYEKLSGSLDALLDSLDAVSGSLYSSANGLDALNAARGTISAGKGDVYAAADQALGDLDAMSEALKPLSGDLGAASDTLRSANTILSQMTTDTLALRQDLDTLDKTLKNAQGDKQAMLTAIDDIEKLQRRLNTASNNLSSLNMAELSSIDNPLFGQTTEKMNGSLDDLNTLSTAYDAISGGLDQGTFVASKLAGTPLAGCTSSEEAYQKAYLLTAQAAIQQVNAATGMNLSIPTSYAAAEATLSASPALAEAKAAAEAKGGEAKAQVAPAEQLYLAAKGAESKEAFISAVLKSQGYDESQIKSALKLLELNATDPGATGVIVQETDDINKTVSNINSSIARANGAIRSVNAASKDASELLGALSDATANAGSLKSVVENIDDLTELAQKDSAMLQSTLDSLERLQKVLDAYQPQLERTSEQVQAASGTLTAASADTGAFLRSAETLLQAGGSQLDAATQQSLSSLASALRGTASALGRNSGVRAAKETINDVVEDVWSDYTGDVSDLLEMDATAEAVSLTDPRNPAPSSVQVLIRTQEIKAEDAQPQTTAAKTTAEAPKTTFLQRVQAMFFNMWAAIVSVFHH